MRAGPVPVALPEVDVIIVTYNSAGEIQFCLKSLVTRNHRYAYRVTVVDNASSDGTPELLATHYPFVNLYLSKNNLGFARANNLALWRTRGKYVVFLNPDTEIKEGGLDKLIDFLETHPEAGAAGPKLLNQDGSLQLTGNTFPSLRNFIIEILFLDRLFPRNKVFGAHKLSWWDRKDAAQVDWVMGACLVVRRDVGEKLGWFDESFFMYFEETDLCRRIRDAGYAVYYVPAAEVIHFGGAGVKAYSGKKVYLWHQSLFRYFKKHSPRQLIFLRFMVLFRAVLRSSLWLLLSLRFGRFALDKSWGYLRTLPLTWRRSW